VPEGLAGIELDRAEPALNASFARASRLALKWRALCSLLLVAAAFLFLSSPWLSGILPNMGLPFGYYGNLNKAEGQLRKLANVEILRVRGNYDVTLKDFTFDLRVDGKYLVALYFREAPTTPTWQVFDQADSLVVRRSRSGPSATWTDAHDWWAFDLKPGNALEDALGCEIRNAHAVFANFGRIMGVIDATPPAALGEPPLGRVVYLLVSRLGQ
jgi:hypothetical protein